jgi:hypothetical protein
VACTRAADGRPHRRRRRCVVARWKLGRSAAHFVRSCRQRMRLKPKPRAVMVGSTPAFFGGLADGADPLGSADYLVNIDSHESLTVRACSPCLKSRTHYLDITGETTSSFRRNTITQKRLPRNRNLPGVGFDVIPTDFIAAMLKKALPDQWRARPFRRGISVRQSHALRQLAAAAAGLPAPLRLGGGKRPRSTRSSKPRSPVSAGD